MNQLFFKLKAQEPYALEYLIPHSGIVDVVARLNHLVAQQEVNPGKFSFIYLVGSKGSGKTHLVNTFCDLLLTLQSGGDGAIRPELVEGSPLQSLDCLETYRKTTTVSVYDTTDNGVLDEKFVTSFVSDYETKRTHGGVILFAAHLDPASLSTNPHLSSRLQNAEVFKLGYPAESELEAIFKSLLERNNLNLSEFSTSYLLKRLPANPLSFSDILARIDELSLSQGRPASFGLIKKALINK